jgi:hypothetical protein
MEKPTLHTATEELLNMISRAMPEGLCTSELVGTPKFHRSNTLSRGTVARLLRASGKVTEYSDGYGCFAPTRWKLRNPK